MMLYHDKVLCALWKVWVACYRKLTGLPTTLFIDHIFWVTLASPSIGNIICKYDIIDYIRLFE